MIHVFLPLEIDRCFLLPLPGGTMSQLRQNVATPGGVSSLFRNRKVRLVRLARMQSLHQSVTKSVKNITLVSAFVSIGF